MQKSHIWEIYCDNMCECVKKLESNNTFQNGRYLFISTKMNTRMKCFITEAFLIDYIIRFPKTDVHMHLSS